MSKALTLRVPEKMHERLRKMAYEHQVSITSLILAAIDKAVPFPLGCDVCGEPHTQVSTPGGFRFCDEHGRNHGVVEQGR